ncbi:MAG: DUF447 domain-containing protein, partial [Thermoplasmata archaeon]
KSQMPYETVVITRNSHINASAIGVYIQHQKYFMRVFENSNTFQNLLRNKEFSINFVSFEQLGLLLRCALKGHNNDEEELNENEILFWNGIPYLKNTCAVIVRVVEACVQEICDWIGSTKCMEIIAEEIFSFGKMSEPVIRSKNIPILECAVLATRYFDACPESKRKLRKKIEVLLPKIEGWEAEVRIIRQIIWEGKVGLGAP